MDPIRSEMQSERSLPTRQRSRSAPRPHLPPRKRLELPLPPPFLPWTGHGAESRQSMWRGDRIVVLLSGSVPSVAELSLAPQGIKKHLAEGRIIPGEEWAMRIDQELLQDATLRPR